MCMCVCVVSCRYACRIHGWADSEQGLQRDAKPPPPTPRSARSRLCALLALATNRLAGARRSRMEEELAWETHGCESQCCWRGRGGGHGGGKNRGLVGGPQVHRATQGEAGPWPGHLCLSLLSGSRRNRIMLHRCRAQWLHIWDSGCPERGKPGVTAILDNNLLSVASLKAGQASLLPSLPYGLGLLPSPFFFFFR